MRNLIWLVMMSCSGEVKDTGESGPGGESVVTGDSGATDCAPAEETCDGVDNDCDGEVDEAEAADASSWYRDGDGDGLGDPAASSTACEAPDGYVAEASDCDDQDASVGPGRAWYLDEDGDGYGGASTTESCVAPEGYVAYGGDCDDGDPAYNPGGTESDCRDPNDYNCDGSVGYSDADGDGYAACEECDDSSSEVRPDAEERCDGIDDDCDGLVDDDDPDVAASMWYADTDGDGLGDGTRGGVSCEAPAGYVSNADDTVGRVQGRVVDPSWEPLVGVTVTVGDEVSTTDEDGFFYVDDLTTDSAVDVYGRAEGYTTGHRQMEVYPERWSFVTLMLLPMESGSFEASTGGDLTLDGVSLSFPADAIADEDGAAYSGPVTVEVGLLNDADELLAAPGNMLADDGAGGEAPLQSFGMAEVRLSDAAGAPLNLASGSAASVSWTLVGAADFDEGDAVGLFWFDEDAGIWREHGAAGEAKGGELVAEVSHFTWWNADAFENLDGCAPVELADPDHPDELIQDCSNVVFVDRDSFTVGIADWDDVNERCTLDIPLPVSDGVCHTDERAGPALDSEFEVYYNVYQWTWKLQAADADCVDCDADADVTITSEFSPRGAGETGDSTGTVTADEDLDGFYAESAGGSDCDDGDDSVHPRADDPCDDGIDSDCDDATDDDQDGDGAICEDAGGDDCDDADPSVGGPTELYPDEDDDGFGGAGASPTSACELSGAVADNTDCDDADAEVHPGATEGECGDAVDSNCDGYFGTSDAIDHDGDGASACTDCDDADGSVGAPTVSVWYPDEDGDGYGDADAEPRELIHETLCEAPEGFSTYATDCDDGEVSVHPGAEDACDGSDSDCDGLDTKLSVYDELADPGLDGEPYSIQKAIDASSDGDLVCVHAGTYHELIDFKGRAIEVLGLSGPGITVIDGGGDGPVVTFDSAEDGSTILTGFTITGGQSIAGGGIYISGASPTLTDLIVTGNKAGTDDDTEVLGEGGGIYLIYSNAYIEDVIVTDNQSNYEGGGIDLWYSGATLESVTVSDDNRANNWIGGGIAINPGCDDATLSNVTVSGNEALYVGGVNVWSSAPDLSGIVIEDNVGTKGGGAMQIYEGAPNLTGAIIRGNSGGTAYAGGIVISGNLVDDDSEIVPLKLKDITFTGNAAGSSGGAIYANDAEISIEDCVFTDNTANMSSGGGGAIFAYGTASDRAVSITGSRFTDNLSWVGGAIYMTAEAAMSGERLIVSDSVFEMLDTGLSVGTCTDMGGTLPYQIGGVFVDEYSDAEFTNTTFYGLKACNLGGALGADSDSSTSALSLTNVLFDGNASKRGGAIAVGGKTSFTINNSMFYGNLAQEDAKTSTRTTAEGTGAAIYMHTGLSDTSFIINNTIFSDNVGVNGKCNIASVTSASPFDFTYSIVHDSDSACTPDPSVGFSYDTRVSLSWDSTDLTDEPEFQDLLNFYLKTTSPGFDSGDPTLPSANECDDGGWTDGPYSMMGLQGGEGGCWSTGL